MNIIIIDDDPVVRDSLKIIVEAGGIDVVGQGASGRDVLALYEQHLPDVVLTDIRMEGMNGLDAAEALLARHPDAKILLLTTFNDGAYISQAMALGCRGYLLKQNFASILPSLHAVYAGSFVFDSEVVDRLAGAPELAPDDRLNDRENELVALVAEGLNNKEIAAALNLSEGTVRNYLSDILDKLDLRDRTQLAVAYYKRILEGRP